jgi:pimeloyl-ACP methyl ester carboxylesterase
MDGVAESSVKRPESWRVKLDGSYIYYQVTGEGPPIVLVHGLSGSGRWWARNVESLSRRFRVYLIDLIGFGQSRGGQAFVLGEAGACLARWMDRVGLEQASLIGHSMGGLIVANLAADEPERVDRLVLVDAATPPLASGYLRQAYGLLRGLQALPLRFLPLLFADAWRAGPRTIVRAGRELLTVDFSARLAQIRAPVLLIWGEHDWIVPLEVGEQIRGQLEGAELVVIERAGHNPMWERPDEFNRLVGQFLLGETGSAAPQAGELRAAHSGSGG